MRQIGPYTMRLMEPGDVPTVAAIDRLSFPAPWPASSYLYELRHRDSSHYYVLLKPAADDPAADEQGWRRWLHGALGLPGNSRVIGYVGLRKQTHHSAHLSTIAVHPNWRGNGLGELLLLTALELAVELELKRVSLEVRPSNRVAQRLYRKYGFQFKGVHPAYYRDSEDAWLMLVEVDQASYRGKLAALRQALEARLQRQQTERA